jgi:CHAT domain-containing protein
METCDGHELMASRQALSADPQDAAVLVEYFGVGDRLLAFIVRPESDVPEVAELSVDRERVESVARDSIFATGGDRAAPEDSAAWAAVSSALVAPALRSTAPGEVVWFVGHDALHLLPLHAAPLPDGGYLVDRNPVCYAPSASVMRFCQDKHRERDRTGIVVGDPGGDLPHAAAEARSVAVVLGSEPLIGGSATRNEVLGRLEGENPAFLHFACHGFFDPLDPMSSGIELAGAPGAIGDRLTARDLLGLELNPALVTLSACRTGIQQRRPGDELLGLARALLYAGTPAAMLTLWSVEDLSTRVLMERFYTELVGVRDGNDSGMRDPTLADALRLAQQHTMSLTAAAAVDELGKGMLAEGGDADARLTLLMASARVQAAVGDFAAAADSYETAVRLMPSLRDRPDDRFSESLDRAARLLRFKARRPSSPDYERRPFADPYHWAPFALHGDWR